MNLRGLFETGGGRGLLVAAAVLLAVLDALLCARAALGRTGSWSFPIDDAYIYANYARALAAGQPFQYNPGEISGGVTGPAWMILTAAVQPLTALLGPAPAALAPAAVQAGDPTLALTAGRLYATAYLLGVLGLAAAACAVAWLAWECLRVQPGPVPAVVALLAGAFLLTDHNIIWAAYSGLELPLALALVPLVPATILHRMRSAECGIRNGDGAHKPSVSSPAMQSVEHTTQKASPLRIPHSALRIAFYAIPFLLPWVRPELAVIGAVGAGGLAWGAGRGRVAWRTAAVYSAALLAGLGSMSALFLIATGRPLPSSFYAKVAPFRLAELPAALLEWVAAHAWQPFALAACAALGVLLLAWSAVGSRQPALRQGRSALRTPALLPALCALAYFAAMLVALRWFGQQDRYILPIHTLLLPPAVAPLALLADRLVGRVRPIRLVTGRRSWGLGAALVAIGLVAHLAATRQWAATDYALFVQNIEDAHVAPARWIATHTPAGAIVAAEPIGALRLFSERSTVDLVGLTTPAQLGHYGDWLATYRLLQARHAAILLYYPAWWPAHRPLPWVHERARFTIPDNRIAGDSVIAVYALDSAAQQRSPAGGMADASH